MHHTVGREYWHRYRHRRGAPATMVALALILVGAVATGMAQERRPNVLTTVAPLTNIVKNVGGPFIDPHGLIPAGMDSHTFEPAPSDVKYVAAADLIILNGLDLETPTEKLARANMKPTARLIKLGDQTITAKEYVFDWSFPKSGGHPNPHLWMNPTFAACYAELVRDALSAVDPGHSA
jgi:ABC-type Zn uptake system ZnuABC Zn-binding protein ZnuA